MSFSPQKQIRWQHRSQKTKKAERSGGFLYSTRAPARQLTWTSQSSPTLRESFFRLRVDVLAQYVKAAG